MVEFDLHGMQCIDINDGSSIYFKWGTSEIEVLDKKKDVSYCNALKKVARYYFLKAFSGSRISTLKGHKFTRIRPLIDTMQIMHLNDIYRYILGTNSTSQHKAMGL